MNPWAALGASISRRAAFNLLFWTPFWLVPWSVYPFRFGLEDIGTKTLSHALAGFLVSAGLAALAELCGRHRRYFFLAAGLICWIGAQLWTLFIFSSSDSANPYIIATAVEYLIGDGSELTYIAVNPWVVVPLLGATIPFIPLVMSWKHLAWPASRRFAVYGVLAALSLIPIDVLHNYWLGGGSYTRPDKPIYRVDDFIPFNVYYEFSQYLELRRALLVYRTQAPLLVRAPSPPLTLIVLVGETMPRRHMSLYGYCRDTSPQLRARAGDLIVFHDMVSTVPLTTLALHSVFEMPSVPTTQGPSASTLIAVLNKAGFETYWLSNQYQYGGVTDVLTVLTSVAQHQVWARRYDERSGISSTDEVLLPSLGRALASPAPHKAIFLHLIGTHMTYSDRYPRGFARGWPALGGARDADDQVQIDNLDTAVRYEDKIIAAAIAAAERAGGDVALMYFSDHGEEIFDQYRFAGHSYPRATRSMLEIPFFFWLSQGLRHDRPDLVRALQRASAERLQLADVPPLVMDMSGVKTVGDTLPHPLQPGFRTARRVVGRQDYDRDKNLGRTPELTPACPLKH